MSRFLHTSIRLNCDLRKAYRLFTLTEELEKWFAKDLVATISKNQTLINKESVKFDFPVQLSEEVSVDDAKEFKIDIKFMQCTSETEYCTEIHLMQHGFKDTERATEIRNIYLDFWKSNLETLRQKVNGNWIIQDSELTLRFLK